jgi:hypothetical protein
MARFKHPRWFGTDCRWAIYSNADRLRAKVRIAIEALGGKILEKAKLRVDILNR